MTSNKLQLVIKETGVRPTQATALLNSFGDLFVQAHKLKTLSETIKVDNIDQVEEMEKARELRLQLVKIRTNASKTKTELKAGYLLGANAVQRIFNDIKKITKPAEEHLMKQEKFAERIREIEELNIEAKRKAELLKYAEHIHVSLHPSDLSIESFDGMIETYKFAFEAKKKAEEDAKKERIEKEKQQELFNKRKLKLASYTDFVDTSELSFSTTAVEFIRMLDIGVTGKKEYKVKQEKIRKENNKLRKELEVEKLVKQKEDEARDKKEAKIKAENDKKIRLVNEAKEKAEAELQQKRDAEKLENAKKIMEDRAIVDAKEKAEKEALLAPDKEKLLLIITQIEAIKLPALKSKDSQDLLNDVQRDLEMVIRLIENGVNKGF